VTQTRLLLAEDDHALASILEEYLQESDFDIVVCHRGDDALEILQSEPFDLVLSDIVMPGCDGLQLLFHVREAQLDTLVMLMTGYSGIENAIHAVEAGAYDFISKPFQLPEIRVRLENAAQYLHLKRRFTALEEQMEKLEQQNTPPPESVKPAATMVTRAYGKNATGLL